MAYKNDDFNIICYDVFTHKSRRHSQLDERHVEDETRENEEKCIHVLDLRVVDDRSDDQINGDDQYHIWNDNGHLCVCVCT